MRIILGLLILFPSIVFGQVIQANFSNTAPFQGEAVIVKFLDKNLVISSAEFDGEKVPIFSYKGYENAIFGITAAKKPGIYLFSATFTNGEKYSKQITVQAKKFSLVILPVPEKLEMTPKQLTANLGTQNTQIKKTTSTWKREVYFNSGFGLPLYDNRRLGSLYGEIRRTGSEEIRHLGVDFTAKKGAMVAAINGGVVSKAYLDPIYGNSVILDHGGGIYSLYLHLNEIKTKEGAVLKKGTVLGTVGETGYASGPHLHLSLKIGSVSVDPLKFVSIFK